MRLEAVNVTVTAELHETMSEKHWSGNEADSVWQRQFICFAIISYQWEQNLKSKTSRFWEAQNIQQSPRLLGLIVSAHLQ